jgi:aryl-alcohol dehydrogenase-like predicted oxidoreductase
VGATSPEQMIQNIDAISWEISEEHIKAIDEIVLG